MKAKKNETIKRTIKIVGSFNSCNVLKKAINSAKVSKLPFNNYLIDCDSISEAQELLSKAYDLLRSEEPEYMGLVLLSVNALKYDDATAEILKQ